MNEDIYIGDDTNAFDQTFMIINANIPEGYIVSKAELKIGRIKKTFVNPIFPLKVNFTSSETNMLSDVNIAYLAVYDEKNRKKTCSGQVIFNANSKVV